MIHPGAIKEFLERELDNHVWMKRLKHRDLNVALASLGFQAACDKPLRKHQKVCILLGLAYPRFAFWLDMGTGKTRIVLELLQHFWRTNQMHRAMVLCISDEAIDEWEKQIRKWKIKIPHVGVGNSSTAEKWQAVAELGAGIIIATYSSFNHMFTKREKEARKGKRARKVRLRPDPKKIKAFATGLDAFIMDESVHLGNHQSLGHRIARRVSKNCKVVYALAGVPFGLEPMLVWSQMYLVDRGDTLGDTLGMFRNAFYTEKRGWFTMYEYKFRKDMQPVLSEMMLHRSISYDASECQDLPPVTPIVRNITLPPETMAYYEQALMTLRRARGNKGLIENTFLRMRQISSGFLGFKHNDEKAQFIFPKNPKLDDILNSIEDMPYNCKFVIFHEFTPAGQLCMDGLAHRGINAGWIRGGITNSKLLRRRFDDDDPKKFKGLLINWRKGAESLNLQRANYKHFLDNIVSVIYRKQAQKRCFRGGQTRKGFMFDYVATTADKRIMEFHRTGGNLFQALMRDPYELLG